MSKNSKRYAVVKQIVGITVSASTSLVVGHLLNAHTPADLGRFARIGTKIGKVAIGVTVSDQVTEHVLKIMDDLVTSSKNVAIEVEKAKADKPITTESE